MKNKKPIPVEKKPKKVEPFVIRTIENAFLPAEAKLHIYGEKERVCLTDTRGYPTPKDRNPGELRVDASEGFIPLWAEKVNLRWRFSPSLTNYFQYPDHAKNEIRDLIGQALVAWGDAAPIRFSERDDSWDFEIVLRPDDCNRQGCTLASAFFPDSGRHKLALFPTLFQQNKEEQVETLIHEFGHIFGLRHFFAEVSEKAWPSLLFGTNSPFTIMNYGDKSRLTEMDKSDLKKLYQKVWCGELTEINGTPIRTFKPFHTFGPI